MELGKLLRIIKTCKTAISIDQVIPDPRSTRHSNMEKSELADKEKEED